MNLRAKYFDQLEEILADIKMLISKNEKFGKHNYFVGKYISGLKKIKTSFARIINYNATDDSYWQVVGAAAVHVNILFNSLRTGKLKEETLALYQKFCRVLPKDFQLNLFGCSREFGWEMPDKEALKPFKSVVNWVQAWHGNRFDTSVSPWKMFVSSFWGRWESFKGIQLECIKTAWQGLVQVHFVVGC